jgi:hypothetical protein
MNNLAKIGGVTLVCSMVILAGCTDNKEESKEVAVIAEVQPAPEKQPAVPAMETQSAEDVAIEVATAIGDEKPFMATASEIVVTAIVKGINKETREVTLEGPEGEAHIVMIGEEARNLDQVEVGDELTVTYLESVTVEVVDGQGVETSRDSLVTTVRTEAGEKPGAIMSESEIAVYKVEAINIEANTFQLKDNSGMVKEFTAKNPENLKRSSVGDAVIISTTQAVAISVVVVPKS